MNRNFAHLTTRVEELEAENQQHETRIDFLESKCGCDGLKLDPNDEGKVNMMVFFLLEVLC